MIRSILLTAALLPTLTFAQQNAILDVQITDTSTRTSIPPGAQRVAMMTLALSASCSAPVTVRGVTLYKRGLGAQEDIERVYGESQGLRLGRGRGVANSDGKIILRFRRFVIAPCDTVPITIRADFSETAAVTGEHRLDLRSPADIMSDARVRLVHSSATPVRRTVGPVAGSITVAYLNLMSPIRYGRHRRVARFHLEADGRGDHLIRSIRFRNLGSADDDEIRNLVIESSRRQRLTKVTPSMIGDQALLVFDPPLVLEKNQGQRFDLRADVRARSRRTIRFVIEEPGDIDAIPRIRMEGVVGRE